MPNNFSYNLNIPFATNSPSVDQPNMKINTNNISDLIDIDHVGFNTNFSGIHQQVTLRNQSAPGLGDGQGVHYAALLNGNSWPVWQNALGSFALMSQASSPVASGFVSLPAGLLLQWGFNSAVSSGSFASGNAAGTVTFSAANTAFNTNCFTVLTIPSFTTVGGAPSSDGTVNINQSTLSKLSFNWVFNSNSAKYTGFYWMAIGN